MISTVHRAQAAHALSTTFDAALINLSAAATCVGIMLTGRPMDRSIVVWCALLLLITTIRLVLSDTLRRRNEATNRPDLVIMLMAMAAGAQGLAWASLTIIFVDLNLMGEDAGIALVLGGLAGGALLKQSGNSKLSFSYSTPILAAIGYGLVRHGGTTGLVTTVYLGLLTLLFYHVALKADRAFVLRELTKLKITAVAQSLTVANEDIRQKNLRLEVLANGDPVTGLYNRPYFNSRLVGELAAARVAGRGVAVLLLDVDRFKLLNNAFGHRGGDEFLTLLGQRLRQAVADEAVVARISGDEFAVMVLGPDMGQRIGKVARAVLDAAQLPITIDDNALIASTSVGLALFPDHAEDAEGLVTAASMALAEAKTAGRGTLREFTPELRLRIDRQRAIEADLAHAIEAAARDPAVSALPAASLTGCEPHHETGRIEAWFQPQIDLNTGEITGFEALVRWMHPRFGPIAPPDIITAAQTMGLSEPLTRCIGDHVCRLLRRLPDLGLPDARVALNVSPREFSAYDVATMLEQLTARHRIDRRLFEIEITEETLLDPAVAGVQLERIEQAGHRLAVDDFGIGYSSLAYLIQLKIDRLKLDRTLVTDVATSHANEVLIGALVGIGHALGVSIIVEGVENGSDAVKLASLGCNIGQGFHFARPMPVDHLPAWLDSYRSGPLIPQTGQAAVA